MTRHDTAYEIPLVGHNSYCTEAFPTSWEKSIQLIDFLSGLDSCLLVDFAIKKVCPNLRSRNKENLAMAKLFSVSDGTIENWRSGGAKCSVEAKMLAKVGALFDGPESVVRELSKYTGINHSDRFDWMEGYNA
jgi:hypothetical protein